MGFKTYASYNISFATYLIKQKVALLLMHLPFSIKNAPERLYRLSITNDDMFISIYVLNSIS